MLLQPIESVTHAHLVYAAAAELRRAPGGTGGRHPDAPVRILDVGCGTGSLLVAVNRHLPGLIDHPVETHGFDVHDARIQRTGFLDQARERLGDAHPGVDWTSRLSLIHSRDPWPVADGSFDVVLTNQVLEHVTDLDRFLGELVRVLRPGGVCLNLFPVRSVVIEGHVGAPFAHWISSDDLRERFLHRFARLGLSRFGPMRMNEDLTPDEYGRTRAEYVATQTHYRSFTELARRAHRQGLRAGYRWTPEFYALKLGYLSGRDVSHRYGPDRRPALRDALLFPVLARVASVSVVFDKALTYDPDAPGATRSRVARAETRPTREAVPVSAP